MHVKKIILPALAAALMLSGIAYAQGRWNDSLGAPTLNGGGRVWNTSTAWRDHQPHQQEPDQDARSPRRRRMAYGAIPGPAERYRVWHANADDDLQPGVMSAHDARQNRGGGEAYRNARWNGATRSEGATDERNAGGYGEFPHGSGHWARGDDGFRPEPWNGSPPSARGAMVERQARMQNRPWMGGQGYCHNARDRGPARSEHDFDAGLRNAHTLWFPSRRDGAVRGPRNASAEIGAGRSSYGNDRRWADRAFRSRTEGGAMDAMPYRPMRAHFADGHGPRSRHSPPTLRTAQIPISQAMRIAEHTSGGPALGARFMVEGAQPIYLVRTVAHGRLWRSAIDARSGRVLGTGSESLARLEPQARQNVRRLRQSSASLLEAISAAERDGGGRVTEAELDIDNGNTGYHLQIDRGGATQLVDVSTANAI